MIKVTCKINFKIISQEEFLLDNEYYQSERNGNWENNRIEINLESFHGIFCGLAVKSPGRYGDVIIFTNSLSLDFLNLL